MIAEPSGPPVPRFYSGSTQLLGRVLPAASPDPALVLAPVEPGLPHLLAERLPNLAFLYLDYAVYRKDREMGPPEGADLRFAPRVAPLAPRSLAAVYFPKAKDLARDLLAQAAGAVAPGGTVLAVGPNHGGIRSARPLVESTVGPVTASHAARHCVLLTATRSASAAPSPEPLRFEVTALGHTVQVVSYPGVFSHGRLDPGTAMLLEAIGTPDFDRALDLGCGAGVVGAALLAARSRGRVDCADSFAPALESTAATLGANGLRAEAIFPSDGFSDVEEAYDLILLNPPFHAGLRASRDAADRMMVEAAGHLVPGGRFVIVANAFLDYFTPLRRAFRKVTLLAEDRRYRVIEARDPVAPPRTVPS